MVLIPSKNEKKQVASANPGSDHGFRPGACKSCTRRSPGAIGNSKVARGSAPGEHQEDTRKSTGESSSKGYTPNGKSNTKCERSWRLATRGRFRANGYACCFIQPFQNMSRNLFPPRWFSPPRDSAGSIAQRDNRCTNGYLACTKSRPVALRAAVRCSRVPRWG
jgi:hypothetical protein